MAFHICKSHSLSQHCTWLQNTNDSRYMILLFSYNKKSVKDLAVTRIKPVFFTSPVQNTPWRSWNQLTISYQSRRNTTATGPAMAAMTAMIRSKGTLTQQANLHCLFRLLSHVVDKAHGMPGQPRCYSTQQLCNSSGLSLSDMPPHIVLIRHGEVSRVFGACSCSSQAGAVLTHWHATKLTTLPRLHLHLHSAPHHRQLDWRACRRSCRSQTTASRSVPRGCRSLSALAKPCSSCCQHHQSQSSATSARRDRRPTATAAYSRATSSSCTPRPSCAASRQPNTSHGHWEMSRWDHH